MKTKILSLLLLVSTFAASAQNLIYDTLSITNTPTNGYTLTINATVFTWTNSATGPYQIANTNSIGAAATNLFNVVALAGLQVRVVQNTNGITFSGFGLSSSVSTGWATNLFTTNTVTPAKMVVVPMSAIDAASRPGMASQLVSDLDTYSTNALGASSPVLTNHVALSTVQTITGAKTFTAANGINGTVGSLTNGAWTNPNFTNGQNFGNPFRSPGGGTGSEQFGLSASAVSNFASAFGDGASAAGQSSVAFGNNASGGTLGSTALGFSANSSAQYGVAVGYSSVASGSSSVAIGASATASGGFSSACGQGANAGGLFATALGLQTTASFDNSTAIGQNATTTATNQIMLGIASGSVAIPGNLEIDGVISNATFAGDATIGGNFTTSAGTINTLKGQIILPRFNNTSLGNGGNAAVSTGTNYLIKVSGPSASFSIAGLAGGTDDRFVVIQNSTGQQMTILNDSGVDPTAANRIYTGSGADYVTTANPAFVTLKYEASTTHWLLMNHN